MRRNDQLVDKINYGIMLFLLFIMPVLRLLRAYTAYFGFSTFLLNFKLGMILWLVLPILMITTLYQIHYKRIKWNVYYGILTVLTVCFIFSTIFSSSPMTSLYGAVNRNEGFLSLLCYYFILVTCSTIHNKKWIMKLIHIWIGIGLFQVGYGILQTLFRFPFIIKYTTPYMAIGFCDNPNFFGSYLVLLLGICMGLFLFSKEKKRFYFISSLIFMIGLELTQSTGPFLGLIAMMIFAIILCWIKKLKQGKNWVILCLSLFSVFAFTSLTTEIIYRQIYRDKIDLNYSIKGDMIRFMGGNTEQASKVTGAVYQETSEFGSGRLDLWKISLSFVPKHPIFGVGIDNLGSYYPQYWGETKIDKAHNDYLQVMVTCGIPATFTFLTLLFLILGKGMKSKDGLVLALLFGFTAYSAQAFANISVVNVAPYYYMVCGFIIGIEEMPLFLKKNTKKLKH